MLQNGVKLALETPEDWKELIDSMGSRTEIITLLIKLLDYVGDQSAFLCLTLAALTAEKSGVKKHALAEQVELYEGGSPDSQCLFQMINDVLASGQEKSTEN